MKEFITSIPGIISVISIICLFLIKYIPKTGKRKSAETNVRLIMQIVMSITMLISGLYIILSKDFSEDTVKWAYGIIGLVAGFWLPS
jgi:uncharacterized membrane protein SirB2